MIDLIGIIEEKGSPFLTCIADLNGAIGLKY
jgi:hypothetical protein